MKSFYDRNIFTRKRFHKEIQVDFSKIEICLLQNRIKQLESYINCFNDKSLKNEKDNEGIKEEVVKEEFIKEELMKQNEVIKEKEFGIDENGKRYIKKHSEYLLYY